ncbi:adenosylmethionine decarboxylase [Candidatus Woesearchaeota archaeon]|nr:adenosylmethionine decarboxylase [Candidatus Woesearchaeota archaeon]
MPETGDVSSNKQIQKRPKGVKYGFGPHLTLDGYECDSNKLDDMNFLYGFLDTMPERIGMTKLMPPYILYYDGKDKPEDRGFSGVVIIAESHISIHTYPEKRFLTFDIYSCKIFDIEKTAEYVSKAFGIGNYDKKVTKRGREFPKDMESVEGIIDHDRKAA